MEKQIKNFKEEKFTIPQARCYLCGEHMPTPKERGITSLARIILCDKCCENVMRNEK